MLYRRVVPLLPCIFLGFPAFSQDNESAEEKASTQSKKDDRDVDKPKEKIKFEGFVRSIMEAENFKNGEVFHEARLEIKTKRRHGFRGNLEVDFRTKTDDIQVNEAYLDKKFDSGVRMKGGYDLKRFGLEYEESRLERPTVDRSYMYRRLDIFNYTGRESVLRFERGSEDGLFHDWSFTASFSEAQNFTLLGNWQTGIDSIDARYGLWIQLGTDKIEDGSQGVGAIMNSLWHRRFDNFWQVEWVTGVDPNQTEFEVLFDDDERVYFTGINTLFGRTFFQEDDESLWWMGGLTGMIHNLSKGEYNTLGTMLGVRYDLDTLRVSLNAEFIGTNSPVNTKKRSYNESNAKLEALYAF